jgi:hypothetical protein
VPQLPAAKKWKHQGGTKKHGYGIMQNPPPPKNTTKTTGMEG